APPPGVVDGRDRVRHGIVRGQVPTGNESIAPRSGLWEGPHHYCEPAMTRQPARPAALDLMAAWMAPFAPLFTRPTFANLLVLVTGALLAPGRRTVAAALSILGLREARDFTNFHRVL